MNNRCYIKQADASGTVWNIFDASDEQIGATSSREAALRIASLASHDVQETQEIETKTLITEDERKAVKNVAQTRPQMFEYSQGRSRASSSLLKKCYGVLRLIRRKTA